MATSSLHLRPATVAAALAAFAAVAAATDPFADPLAITVHADRYVVGGQALGDLDRLEAAVVAIGPGSVRLHVCEVAATRAFKAVMHRLREVPVRTLVLPADHPECRSAAAPTVVRVADRPGRLPRGIDDEAVERWWESLMP